MTFIDRSDICDFLNFSLIVAFVLEGDRSEEWAEHEHVFFVFVVLELDLLLVVWNRRCEVAADVCDRFVVAAVARLAPGFEC